MSELLLLGILLTVGLSGGALIQRSGLPRVTAYVAVGVLFSGDFIGRFLDVEVGRWASELTTVSLVVLAYLIGGSISPRQVRRFGASLLLAAGGQTAGAVLVTAAALGVWMQWGFAHVQEPWLLAALAGAIAASTDPAATIAVIHQYRAKGPMTSMLMGLVAVDDALGILIFSLVMAGVADSGLGAGLLHAGYEIAGAVVLGGLTGALLGTVAHRLAGRDLLAPMIVAALLLDAGVARGLGLSALLAGMTAGFVARLVHRGSSDPLFEPIERSEDLIFVVLFALAGLHFDIDVFIRHLDLIAVYMVARAAGKYLGAMTGARLGGAGADVYRWLGLALLPQAGVAIGLALSLSHIPALAPLAVPVLNIIIGATVLHELMGPVLARLAVGGAGELGETSERPQ